MRGPWETPVRMSTWLHQRTKESGPRSPTHLQFSDLSSEAVSYLFRQMGPGPLLTKLCTEASCPVNCLLPHYRQACPAAGPSGAHFLEALTLQLLISQSVSPAHHFHTPPPDLGLPSSSRHFRALIPDSPKTPTPRFLTLSSPL